MEKLPARRITGALAKKGDSLAISTAGWLGRRYRSLRPYVAAELSLYSPTKIVIDATLVGGVIYLATFAALLTACVAFALLATLKFFYYIGYTLTVEVASLPVKLAIRILQTLDLLALVAITVLFIVSSSPLRVQAYVSVVALLSLEVISVSTWYTAWALRDEQRNLRDIDYEPVVMRSRNRFVVAALFVMAQVIAFIPLLA